MKSARERPRSGPSGSPEGAPPLEFHEPPPRRDESARNEAFLLLHGLNLNPARLGAWRELLGEAGFRTVLVRLRGHRGTPDPDWGRIRPADWGDDLVAAREAALARWPGTALSCFGYSLGGLLGLAAPLVRRGAWPESADGAGGWRRAIWLCPAFRLRGPWVPLLRLGSRWLPGRLELPSWAPRHYRLHRTTSVAAFRALCTWIDALPLPAAGDWEAAAPWPQLLLYVPGDELVSTSWVGRYGESLAPRTRQHGLHVDPVRRYPRHLAIDPDTVGETGWAELRGVVQAWIAETDRTPGGPGAGSTSAPERLR